MNKILHIKVKPKSGKQELESFGDGRYLVYLKSAPENDKANIELIKLLSKELFVPFGRIKIVRGRSSRDKILRIE